VGARRDWGAGADCRAGSMGMRGIGSDARAVGEFVECCEKDGSLKFPKKNSTLRKNITKETQS